LGKEGAVGYFPTLMRPFYPVKIVKFDVEKETPIRDKNGFCTECDWSQPGELIGRIDPTDPSRDFVGYTDKKATEKKILRDVFVKGDSWFRSGDLLRMEKDGFVYFVDRIGDTFRWKGENVSTSEVAEVISCCPGVIEVNVYGVTVPNKDGRAGMASLVVSPEFSLEFLYQHVRKNLANFASPLFLRIQPQIEITATFKHRKVELVQQGFNPLIVKDPVYFRDDSLGKFVVLDQPLYQKICNNQISRL